MSVILKLEEKRRLHSMQDHFFYIQPSCMEVITPKPLYMGLLINSDSGLNRNSPDLLRNEFCLLKTNNSYLWFSNKKPRHDDRTGAFYASTNKLFCFVDMFCITVHELVYTSCCIYQFLFTCVERV